MAFEALELRPVKLLRANETIKVHYLDVREELALDVSRPVEVLPPTANDDETSVEVLDENMMAVRQVGEDGTVNTLCLSPQLAVQLSHLISSFVYLGPTGTDWMDGRDAA